MNSFEINVKCRNSIIQKYKYVKYVLEKMVSEIMNGFHDYNYIILVSV